MKLTTKTDFCLRALIYLQQQNKKVKIREIAEFYNVSKNHMSVAVNSLSEFGYIISSPGPSGGVVFNKEMENKSVRDLVIKVEDLCFVECFNDETNTCRISNNCKLKKILFSAKEAFLDELGKYKIKDLI